VGIDVPEDRASPLTAQRRDLSPHVYRHKGRPGVFAQLYIGGRYTYLGYFKSVEEAAVAVAKAKAEGRRP
jgi:hypothetical protein